MENQALKILFNAQYVVLMCRYGEQEGHIYVLGIYDDLELAKKEAEEEKEYRGGKYEWHIELHQLNKSRRHREVDQFRIARSSEMDIRTDEENKDIRDFLRLPENKDKKLGELMDLWEKRENGSEEV